MAPAWEVLRDAVERVGVKAVAARLKLSSALVYKWCQEPRSRVSPTNSGALNPLDRLKTILDVTDDPRLVHWLCQCIGGFYVGNPRVNPEQRGAELLAATHHVVEDFGELLASISRSIENDGCISKEEASLIRGTWERLKSQAECFVVACERGFYASGGQAMTGQPPADVQPTRTGEGRRPGHRA